MTVPDDDPQVKSPRQPDKATVFLDGSVRVSVELGGVAVGRGAYQPGWRWSRHVAPQTGPTSQRHVGCVLTGRMGVRGRDGTEIEAGPKDAFVAEAGQFSHLL